MATTEKLNFDMTRKVNEDDYDSQRETILEHLKKFGTITPLEGLHKYRIGNVQGRIADLRLEGYDITTHQDNPHDFATYRLLKNNS